MTTTPFQPPLNQIALSVVDVRRTEQWFREGLGFLPAGGSRLMASSPLAAKVQGLPKAASSMWWLVGRNKWFQIELFQFRRPIAQLMPADFRPCDAGYTRMGVHVQDFDAALRRLAGLGTQPLAPAQGGHGARRACVRTPDGVYVEIMEADPLPQVAGAERQAEAEAAVRSVTMSTPDLAASVAYMSAITGQAPSNVALHTPGHEALWGLPGASCDSAVFACGDILVELVQYLDPVGKPWPAGYRISDQGILNIAFGARNKRDHMAVYERARAFGARPNCKPVHIPGSGVVYVNDALGFSVEILWMARGRADRDWGFEPLPIDRRPPPDNRAVSGRVCILAPQETVWAVLNDHDAMEQWIGFSHVRRCRAGQPDPDGYGAERVMRGLPGTVVEQITAVEPMRCIRYRVIKGGPVIFHNGEIVAAPQGGATEVTWTIRFRSRIPLLGPLLRAVMAGLLHKVLTRGLKPYVEQRAAGGR